MARPPPATGHRHLFVGRPHQPRVAMSRDSAARTSLFVHIWIAKLSIGKYQRLHDRSTRLHPAAVSRSQLHSLRNADRLLAPGCSAPDQHSAGHGCCRADLDVMRADTLPACLIHRLMLMRTRVVVLKICNAVYPDHRDLGRLQISARAAVAARLYFCQQISRHGPHDLDDRHQHQYSAAAPLPRGITTFFAPNDE